MSSTRPVRKRTSASIIAMVALVTPLVVGLAPGNNDDAVDEYARLDATMTAIVEGTYEESLKGVESADGFVVAPLDDVVDEDGVHVHIVANEGDVAALEAELLRAGGNDVSAVGDSIIGTVTLDTLADLASNPRVQVVTTPPMGYSLGGGQGVSPINASEWQSLGAQGEGVKVAIIDAGFRSYTQLLGSHLPSSVRTANFCGPGRFTSDPHGTAVAEIVHEVAPKAELHLVCVRNGLDLINAVDYAVRNDIDIIQHSMGWIGFDTAGDGSGVINLIADGAVDAGIVWVNAAGNSATSHWRGTFTDTNGSGFHNFTANDEGISLTMDPNQIIDIHLRWHDGRRSTNDYGITVVSGQQGGGTTNDRYVYEAGHTPLRSDNPQTGSPDSWPYDTMRVRNNSSSALDVQILIENINAANAPVMDLFVMGLRSNMQHSVAAGSLLDPATSAKVITVGAHAVSNGNFRAYSSQGPTLAGVVKPDLTGPDGTTSAAYGGKWEGTSASAPHVAGAAAILMSTGYGANKSPAQIKNQLVTRHVDTAGIGGTFPNDKWGAGRLKLMAKPGTPFKDVPLTHPFVSEVRWLNQSKVTGGYPDGTFKPSANVSRQAMAAFLYRYAGEPAASSSPRFTDVSTSHPFHKEVTWLASSGVTSGYPDGTFRPSGAVTRQAMAAFLYRYVGEPAFTAPNKATFRDVPTTHTFYKEVEWLATTGITTGYPDGTFRPTGQISRQAMAAFLSRLDDLALEG